VSLPVELDRKVRFGNSGNVIDSKVEWRKPGGW